MPTTPINMIAATAARPTRPDPSHRPENAGASSSVVPNATGASRDATASYLALIARLAAKNRGFSHPVGPLYCPTLPTFIIVKTLEMTLVR